MSTKIFLVTGEELAEHSQRSKDLIFEMFTVAHATYPELTVPQIIEYTQNWAASLSEAEEDWDYVPGLLDSIAAQTAEESVEVVEVVAEDEEASYDEPVEVIEVVAEDEEEPYEIILDEEVDDDLEYAPEFLVDEEEPSTEAQTAEDENVATFNVGGYTVVQQVEDEEEPEEVEEEDNATADFFNPDAPAVISRQKRYKGLLSEAGKLDRF